MLSHLCYFVNVLLIGCYTNDMDARFATTEEIERWDSLLSNNPDGGNVFQLRELAETKRLNGWLPRYLIVKGLAVTVLQKRVPLLGNYWYIPKGPGVADEAELLSLLDPLRQLARTKSVFAIKLEPELLETETPHERLTTLGLVRTAAIQPNVSTVLLDISGSEDEIMASLNQKGRHAIHRAERDGVTVAPVSLTEQTMREMFTLLSSTASGRFESSLKSYQYYSAFWKRLADADHGQLFFAYHESRLVAAAYCMYLGKKGLYKDGASVRERTVYGASHLLQWEIIKWMKVRGVSEYDLCGAPHSSDIQDTAHPFYGIGRFKTSFNKRVTDYIGCYDLVVNPSVYRRWQKIGQRAAVSLSYRFKRRQWF